jgi:RHS repeat-associated protein
LHEWIEIDAKFVSSSAAKPVEATEAELDGEKALKALLAARPANGPPDARGAVDSAARAAAAQGGTADAPITWLFEPESFAPLAKLVNGERFGIVTDHLGTPIGMFDGAGREVWGAEIDVYGDLRNQRGEREACPFRWPGQYEDGETGLYYNRWRYFEAAALSFLSIDPIKLQGGPNLYGYVLDPLLWIDPLGLEGGCGLKAKLRKVLRAIEEKAQTSGNSGIPTALQRREMNKVGEAFVGEGFTVARGRNGEKWLISADGKRLYREPTFKESPFARTGKQANFHERPNTRADWFDTQQTSNVHHHGK